VTHNAAVARKFRMNAPEEIVVSVTQD